jgi:hypothetical protein
VCHERLALSCFGRLVHALVSTKELTDGVVRKSVSSDNR